VNLELPFAEVDPADLDEYLARIDRELDTLFLGEVDATFERLREGGSESVPAA
jgi:hypothetical protein